MEVLGYPDGMKIVFMDSAVLSIPLLIPIECAVNVILRVSFLAWEWKYRRLDSLAASYLICGAVGGRSDPQLFVYANFFAIMGPNSPIFAVVVQSQPQMAPVAQVDRAADF